MKIKNLLRFLIVVILLNWVSLDSVVGQIKDRKIIFPNVPGFITLKTDLHIHSVFSDGSVWPDIRIQEAVRDGLDVISLTEHIEYQPHKEDIPVPDRNRSYNLAKEYAKPYELMIVHGAEITKDMPPGHANALFITDANLLDHEDPLTAYRAAVEQGAFIFWNHPNWIQQQEDGLPVISPLHRKLIDEKLLHGIEVVNDITYSEHAFELAKSNGLTPLGTSDIHGLIDWQFGLANGGHRPITLLFAEERTEESVKKSLFEGRTVAWFKNILIGNEAHVVPLVNACLTFKSRDFIGPSSVEEIVVTNHSSTPFILKNLTDFDFYNQSDIINIEAHGTALIQILTKNGVRQKSLKLEVLNATIGRQAHSVINFVIN